MNRHSARTRSLCLLLASASLLLASHSAAQTRKLQPVDEARKFPGLVEFRTRLLQAVKERDSGFLVSIVDPQIKLGFAGMDGIREFKKQWKPERPDSKIWPVLSALLTKGGSAVKGEEGKEFWAPYVFTRFPENLDPFIFAAVTGKDVILRTAPRADAPVAATLSYDIVEVVGAMPRGPHEKTAWVNVRLANKKQGYVSSQYLYSPTGYRAGFAQLNGRWRMTALVIGD